MSSKRIVITGLGGLCGLGDNAADIWQAMVKGIDGVLPLDDEALAELKVKKAGQVSDRLLIRSQDKSNRSAFITLVQAAAKSSTNFCWLSS